MAYLNLMKFKVTEPVNDCVDNKVIRCQYKRSVSCLFGVCVLLLLQTVFVASAFAANIYVATNGNDRYSGRLPTVNAGHTDGPLATLTAARNAIRKLKNGHELNQPVTVIIAEGTYFINEPLLLGPEDSGTAQAPVTYYAAGKGAVFIGGFAVTNFKEKNGLWVADVSGKMPANGFEQLYINGEYATRAKTPNQGYYSPRLVQQTMLDRGQDRTTSTALQKIFLRPKQAAWLNDITEAERSRVMFNFYHQWDNTQRHLQSSSPQDTSFTIQGEEMKRWNPINKGTRFTVENFKAALDTAGEWYLEPSGRLYYKPKAGESIGQSTVYAPLVKQWLVIKGTDNNARVSNIKFENIAFRVSGYELPPNGQGPVQAAAPVEAAIMVDFTSNISFVKCQMANTGTNAVWFREGCRNGLVEQCYLHSLGAGGIKIGTVNIPEDSAALTQRIVVNNTIIQSGGYVFPNAVALAIFNAANNQVTHNDISNFIYTGISVGWVWGYKPSAATGNLIAFNHIHHLGGNQLGDMGGIYTLGPSAGTQVKNNVIDHITANGYGSWGLYADEGSSDILFENNLVYRTKSAGFHLHYGRNNVIRNNIFALGKAAQLQLGKAEANLSFTFTHNIIYYNKGELFQGSNDKHWQRAAIAIDSNCYFNPAKGAVVYPGKNTPVWKAYGHDANSVIDNPQFADLKNNDFRIQNTALLKQIGFTPFNYSQAGVYGTAEWIQKARLPAAVMAVYDQLMESR